MSDFSKVSVPIDVGGEDAAERLARYEAVVTLLDVCSTQSLQAMAAVLSDPPEGDTRRADTVALQAVGYSAH
jgi:hypothetical protein